MQYCIQGKLSHCKMCLILFARNFSMEYGIWNSVNRKFAIISEYCRTDYDSLVLNQETFPERVRNVSWNAFRNASGTRSGTRPERVMERVFH
jgi:hypothetical protein